MEQKLEDILNRERSTSSNRSRAQKPGIEEKQRELSRMPRRLSEAMRKLESYEFEDAEAKEDFDELLEEYENIRDLENFRDRNQHMFHGPKSLELRAGARADARDGAHAPARAGSDVGQLRHDLDGRPAADARPAGDAGFQESQAGDGAAEQVGLHGAEGRPFPALAQGRAANRAARAARHLPEPAEGSRRVGMRPTIAASPRCGPSRPSLTHSAIRSTSTWSRR